MKKIVLLIVFFCISLLSIAQEEDEKNVASFKLGSGLNFSFNDGNYQFNLGGFIRPSYAYSKIENTDAENSFSADGAWLIISGKALKEKVSFMVQTDFSLSEPLLDAWVAYHPIENISITFGQKQTFVNNREMIFVENNLQFTDRSLLSQSFSNSGREFGVFIQTRFGTNFGIAPQFALTSGDGRNSFGADSRDGDLGGLKIGGRLDLYPLGYFSPGNDAFSADLGHEETLKFVIGSAVSKNNGVSNDVGEGHGDFYLYNSNGTFNLPDYTQFYLDLLMKYKGFSLLAEFVNSSSEVFSPSYINVEATDLLAPQQISEYLVLGDAYNFQTGYVTKSGYSFDFRYVITSPEFESNVNSLLREYNSYTFGLSKYFDNNNLKMQASFTAIDFAVGNNQIVAELVVQVVF